MEGGKWGSKLSYQEVRIMLVYIEVLQKRHRLEWKKIYLGVSIWRQKIGFTVCKMLYLYTVNICIYISGKKGKRHSTSSLREPMSAKVSALLLE